MAYQDYFSSGAPPVIRPPDPLDVGAALGQTKKKAFSFDPLETPWFNRDAYGTGKGFGETTRTNPRTASGIGSFSAYEPAQKPEGFGDAQSPSPFSFGGWGDPKSMLGSMTANGFGQSERLSSATTGGFGQAFPSYDNLARTTNMAKSPAGYSVNKWWDPQSQQNPYGATGGYSGGGQAVFRPGFGAFTPDVIPEINAAAAKYGVPGSFLYAIIAKESSGRWSGGNTRPLWVSSHSPSLGPILGYVGVFEKTANSRGLGALYQAGAQGNRQAQIELLAGVLRSQYDQIRQRNPAYDWINVAAYHYSGDPSGRTNPAGWEKHGTTVDYMNRTREWVNMLGGMGAPITGGPTGGQSGPSGTGVGMAAIWGGNQNQRISQQFGRTAWSTGAGSWMYGYGAGLGVPGGHPGLDVSMSAGTRLYIPVNGTVIRGGGSGSFRDSTGDGPGRGELRIQADDGTLIILGHMRQIPWRPGQRVTVGQLAGLSGGFNGDHLHLEVRVPGNTSTGWKAIDPRSYFGNQSIAYGTPTQSGGYGTTQPSNRPWWETM
jgi:hypothetical protein